MGEECEDCAGPEGRNIGTTGGAVEGGDVGDGGKKKGRVVGKGRGRGKR